MLGTAVDVASSRARQPEGTDRPRAAANLFNNGLDSGVEFSTTGRALAQRGREGKKREARGRRRAPPSAGDGALAPLATSARRSYPVKLKHTSGRGARGLCAD